MLNTHIQEYEIRPTLHNVHNVITSKSSLTLRTYSSNLTKLLPIFNKKNITVYSEINDEYTELEIKNEINFNSQATIEIVFNEYRLYSNKYKTYTDCVGTLTNIINLPEQIGNFLPIKVSEAIKMFILNIWQTIELQSSLSYYEDDGYIEFILFNHTERSDVRITIEF